jgi:hypothetical protein
VIGTDCIGSCKSNYHAIMTTTAPCFLRDGHYEAIAISCTLRISNIGCRML